MKIIRFVLAAVVYIIMLVPINAFSDETLTVNSVEVSKGDIVTYELYMSEVKEPIEAVGAYLSFNPDFLEYIDDSIGFDVLGDAMVNVGENSIYYCAIDIYDGFDFNEDSLVVTASFRVLDTASGATSVTNDYEEIFTFENEEDDLTPNDYKIRQTVSVNTYSKNKSDFLGVNISDGGNTPDTVLSTDNDFQTESEISTKGSFPFGLVAAAAIFVTAAAVVIVVLIIRKH